MCLKREKKQKRNCLLPGFSKNSGLNNVGFRGLRAAARWSSCPLYQGGGADNRKS